LHLCSCNQIGLSVNFWDIERYGGMNNFDFTWVGQTKILVYLVVPQKADLSNLRFADFLAHFAADKDNGMLFVGMFISATPFLCQFSPFLNMAIDNTNNRLFGK
jgi:hypothetical protein